MYLKVTIFLVIVLTPFSASVQQVRDIHTDGPPPEPVIENCETAEDCIRLSTKARGEYDYQKYRIYMELAANKGSAHAQFALAEMIENNIDHEIQLQLWGAPFDSYVITDQYLMEAYTWYKIAELNGHLEVTGKLLLLWKKMEKSAYISRGMRNVETTEDKMKVINAEVSSLVGEKYLNGNALPQDFNKAIAQFNIGMAQDITIAFLGMAKLYEEGYGVEKDHYKARTLYLEHMEDRTPIDADYYYRLGQMLDKGQGGSVERVEAYKWMLMADCAKHKRAAIYLSHIEDRLTENERGEARNLHEKLADKCDNIGSFY